MCKNELAQFLEAKLQNDKAPKKCYYFPPFFRNVFQTNCAHKGVN